MAPIFIKRIESRIFAPASPVNLAVCRIIIFGGMFLWFANRWQHELYLQPELVIPYRFFDVFAIPIAPVPVILALTLVWKASLLGAAVGFKTRFCMAVAAILGWYVLTLENNFGKAGHSNLVPLFSLTMLAFSRAGDALSIDARGKKFEPGGEYRWPIEAVCLVVALVYFAGGFSKIRMQGLYWIFSDNMQWTMVASYYTGRPLLPFGLWMARIYPLTVLLAAGTIVAEVGALLIVLGGRWRLVFGGLLILMKLYIVLMVGPAFLPTLLCMSPIVNWERVTGLFSVSSARESATENLAAPREKTA